MAATSRRRSERALTGRLVARACERADHDGPRFRMALASVVMGTLSLAYVAAESSVDTRAPGPGGRARLCQWLSPKLQTAGFFAWSHRRGHGCKPCSVGEGSA